MQEPSLDVEALIDQALTGLTPKAGAKLVLAYSGGVDSEVLAHGLGQFAKSHTGYRYLLIHIHHGLSDNADEWVQHCKKQASLYELPIEIKYVQVRLGPRLSIEAEARSARYDAIRASMDQGDILLTAHHQDDQLETLLLALKRGLGPKGLSAMGAVQPFDKTRWIVRPLLELSKEQIEAHAAGINLSHITDESNSDSQYDRNFLRLDIIPRLKARWGAIATTASRSASLCAQQQAIVDEEVALRLPALQQASATGLTLDIERLSDYSPAWQSLLLRGHIDSLGFAPPSQVQNEQILSQLIQAKVDAKVEIRVGNMLVRRFKRRAYFSEIETSRPQSGPVSASEPGRADKRLEILSIDDAITKGVALSRSLSVLVDTGRHGPRLRYPTDNERVSIRFGVEGSTRCRPHNRSKGRELKKLWQECGVPPWQRKKVPLLFYGDKLVCVLGYWLEKPYLAKNEDTGLTFRLSKPGRVDEC